MLRVSGQFAFDLSQYFIQFFFTPMFTMLSLQPGAAVSVETVFADPGRCRKKLSLKPD